MRIKGLDGELKMKKALFLGSLTLVALCLVANVSAQPDTASSPDPDQIEDYEKRIEEQQRQLDEMRRELEAMKAESEKSQDHEEGTTAAQEEKETEEVKKDTEEKDAEKHKLILRKNENLTLTFSGRLHRMILVTDDGANTDAFFTDSEQGPTMLRFDATGKASEDLTVGATIETGIRQNPPSGVSQDRREAGTAVKVRIAEFVLDSTRFGKFSLGRGFASAWLTPETDLSGTQFANLLSVGMLAPGMKFVDASDNSLSNIQVLTYFADLERLLLIDRFRYDSPRFGPGLQISSSVANDARWDLTLRAKPQSLGDWKLVAGTSYQDEPFETIDRRWDAAISVLHSPTGLNLTAGGSIDKLKVGRNASSWLIKGGWLADIFSLGKTAFSIDYLRTSDLRLDGDRGESIGLFAVQKWPDYGVDFYAGIRKYDVTRPDINLKDLNILAIGAAFNF